MIKLKLVTNKLYILGVIGLIIVMITMIVIYPITLVGGEAAISEYTPNVTSDQDFQVALIGKNLDGNIYINGKKQDDSILWCRQPNVVILKLQKNVNYSGNRIIVQVKNLGLVRFKSNRARVELKNNDDGLKFNIANNTNEYEILEVTTENLREYLSGYLKGLANTPYRIYMSIRDEGSSIIDDELQHCLYKLGAQKSLQNQYRASYLAVLESGCNIYEELSDGNPLIYKDDTVSMFSGGHDAGNYSSINIKGREVSLNEIGLNVVVYDPTDNQVLDSVTFDTCFGNKIIRKTKFNLEFLQVPN